MDPQHRSQCGATLIYVTNWFIELVNRFSTQQEEKVNVLLRIKQELEM